MMPEKHIIQFFAFSPYLLTTMAVVIFPLWESHSGLGAGPVSSPGYISTPPKGATQILRGAPAERGLRPQIATFALSSEKKTQFQL